MWVLGISYCKQRLKFIFLLHSYLHSMCLSIRAVDFHSTNLHHSHRTEVVWPNRQKSSSRTLPKDMQIVVFTGYRVSLPSPLLYRHCCCFLFLPIHITVIMQIKFYCKVCGKMASAAINFHLMSVMQFVCTYFFSFSIGLTEPALTATKT